MFPVWHPRCGPCPSSELGILDGSTVLSGNQINGHITDTECDRLSNSVISEIQVCKQFPYMQSKNGNSIENVWIIEKTHFVDVFNFIL